MPELSSAEYVKTAINSKEELEKSVTFAVIHVLQKRIWWFHVVVLQRTAKKCTQTYNARAELLYCSLNLSIGDGQRWSRCRSVVIKSIVDIDFMFYIFFLTNLAKFQSTTNIRSLCFWIFPPRFSGRQYFSLFLRLGCELETVTWKAQKYLRKSHEAQVQNYSNKKQLIVIVRLLAG